MPLLPTPSIEELEDHFFGSGAFSFGWFDTPSKHFPAMVIEYNDEDNAPINSFIVTADDFVEAIKKYAELQEKRTYQDLIEDMDAVDVDNCIQLAVFGEIRYS